MEGTKYREPRDYVRENEVNVVDREKRVNVERRVNTTSRESSSSRQRWWGGKEVRSRQTLGGGDPWVVTILIFQLTKGREAKRTPSREN